MSKKTAARAFEAKPVTPEGWKCFFGYYDKTPWSPDGRRFLFHRSDFQDRPPAAEDTVEICLIDLGTGEISIAGRTSAWNFQQGAMLQWLDDERVIFNDRRGRDFICRICEPATGKERVLPRPVSALSRDGKLAVSLNFARLAKRRPGYGYEGGEDRFAGEKWPREDGIYLVDMESGEAGLVVGLGALLEYRHEEGAGESFGWVNHTLFSPDGKKFVFLNRWAAEGARHSTRLFSADAGGGQIRDLLDSYFISHFDWKNNSELLVWAEVKGERGFWTVNADTGECALAHGKLQKEDGHCSFSGGGDRILLDTYPVGGYRFLKLFDVGQGMEAVIGRYYSPPKITNEIRCDLHPRWNRDQTQISFDSAHEGCRRVYTVSLGGKPAGT